MTNLKPGVLFYPIDPKFPAVDFVFVKEEKHKKQVFCVQVTFGGSHQKP